MNIPSLIFLIVFVTPLFVFVIWLLLQDKPKGWKALGVLALLIAASVLEHLFKK